MNNPPDKSTEKLNAETHPVTKTIRPAEHDIGGLVVRRALPSKQQRRVGPFIFFDHMGPATFDAGSGIDVRPHPHIGLSTLTYLFDGALMHRDSLGEVQRIEPGAVNWMTAGSGIVHSERTPARERASGHNIHGIQCWLALEEEFEEIAPSFQHYPKETLPVIKESGVHMTLIAGEAFGAVAPVDVYSPLFYLHAQIQAGAKVPLPTQYAERAVYVVSGELQAGSKTYSDKQLLILSTEDDTELYAETNCELMLLGGKPLDSDRIVWWNFSASSRERLEQAKQDWKEGRFDAVPGEVEFIPLPEK